MIKVPKGEEKKKDLIHLFEGEKISRACENITGNEMSRKQSEQSQHENLWNVQINVNALMTRMDTCGYDFVLSQQLLLFLCKNVSN